MSSVAIIDKVKKLLALSKSSNAAESESARAIANKLIDQYRLSTAELEFSEENSEPIETDPDVIYKTGRVTAHKQKLLGTLAAHYGCAFFNQTTYPQGRMVSSFRLVGRRSDIGICRYMFGWLIVECMRLVELEAKGCGRVFVQSYCNGFVNGIAEQLKLSRTEAQKQASSSAIIKIDSRLDESKDAMYKLHTNLKKYNIKSFSHKDYDAFGLGLARGKAMHLGSAIDSGGTKALKQ